MRWSDKILAAIFFLSFNGLLVRAEIIVAESVSEFSGVQGQDSWFYGFYDGPLVPSSFQEFTFFDTAPALPSTAWTFSSTVPPFTQVFDSGGHPSAPQNGPLHWSVRRYVSEESGVIALTGNISKSDPNGGDGIMGHIFLDQTEVFSQFIPFNDTVGMGYSIVLPSVNIGSTIDFVIDPIGNDLFDSTTFTSTITAIPEPSSVILFAGLVISLFLVQKLCCGRSSSISENH